MAPNLNGRSFRERVRKILVVCLFFQHTSHEFSLERKQSEINAVAYLSIHLKILGFRKYSKLPLFRVLIKYEA